MNLSKLQPYQAKLDNHIKDEHDLHEVDLINKKTVALLTEFYEFINCARFFKFWSVSKKAKPDTLEEYIDTQHFVLSLANEFGVTLSTVEKKQATDLNILAIGTTNMITRLPITKNIQEVYEHIVQFGYAMGFDEKTVTDAYFEKNKVNFERQKSGY